MELTLVVKATIVLVLALLAARLAGRASAAVRGLILAGAFGLLLLLPVAAIMLPARVIEVPAAAYSAPLATTTLTPVTPSTTPPVAADIAPVPPPRFEMPSMRAVVRLVWAAGAVGFVTPLVVALLHLRHLRTRGRPWVHRSQPSSVEVLLHDEVHVPITYGALRPAIALPTDAPQWPEADLRRVLLHELEHVRRRDWPVHMIARAVCALYWFHPLVWIAWRRLCLECERACDDAVVREEDAGAYAAQLVSLARRITKHEALPLLSIAGRSNLSTRVGAMLAGNVARGRVRSGAAIAVAGLAAGAALGIGPLQAVTPTQKPSTQTASAEPTGLAPRFESTSIRRTAQETPSTGHCCEVRYLSGGSVSASNVGLVELISSAYDVYSWWQIDRVPAWANDDAWTHDNRLDVQATARGDATPEEMRLMLRTMLADRFRLTMHRETRIQKVYELVVEPTGHKLQPPVEGKYVFNKDVWMRVDPTTMIATLDADGMAMAQLARALGLPLFTMVIDRTGLTGTYRVSARWDASPDRAASPPADPARPTIFEAFPAQMGLRLRETTGPVEYLVIDRAEQPTLDDRR